MHSDADGLIKIPEDIPYQAEFRFVLEHVCLCLEKDVPDLVHSAYVYGSVATGRAVSRRSDLDLTLLLQTTPTSADKARLETLRQQIETAYPVVSKVDFDIGTIQQTMAPDTSLAWRYWLKHHCRCLYGQNLSAEILPFRPSRALALAINGDYRQVLEDYAARLSACETIALSKKLCREAARKTIRSTNILRHDGDSDWPDSLEEFATRFQGRYPDQAGEAQYFLQQAKDPSEEAGDFIVRLTAFVAWMDSANQKIGFAG